MSGTSGKHSTLHKTQLVLLDPIHNNNAFELFLSTLNTLFFPPFFICFCHFAFYHHEVSSSFHAHESFLPILSIFCSSTFTGRYIMFSPLLLGVIFEPRIYQFFLRVSYWMKYDLKICL
jgi:hypothetical protein